MAEVPTVSPSNFSLCPVLLPFPVHNYCSPEHSQNNLLSCTSVRLRICPGAWTQAIPLSLAFQWGRDPGCGGGGGLTHDHVVADVTESGLLEDVLLKGVGLAASPWVQAGPGGCGRQASRGREWAGAGADLSQHVSL